MISTVCTSIVWLIASSKRWRLWGGMAAVAALVFFLTLPAPKMDYFAIRMGRDPTFTSRTLIWSDSFKLFAEQPVTGFGYNAVWDAFENRLSQYPNAPGPLYAHSFNTMLEWGLQVGAGGIILYLVVLGGIITRAAGVYRRCGALTTCWQALCLLIYVEIYNLANVSSVPINRFGFFILGSTTACLCWQLSQSWVTSRHEAEVVRTSGTFEPRSLNSPPITG
jgi:O-antigen ligase